MLWMKRILKVKNFDSILAHRNPDNDLILDRLMTHSKTEQLENKNNIE